MVEHSTQEQKRNGLVQAAGNVLGNNLGKILAGAMLFGAGMGLEAKTHVVHQKTQEAKIVRHVINGYQLVGDPHYRNAEITLKVDDENKQIYGVLRDESRGIELRINDGLETKESFHQSLYDGVEEDLRKLGDGIDKLGYSIGKEGEKVWEKVQTHYQSLSKKVGEEIKDITD